jgi:hypothetical protein
MPNVIMVSVVMLSVVVLSVMAPLFIHLIKKTRQMKENYN